MAHVIFFSIWRCVEGNLGFEKSHLTHQARWSFATFRGDKLAIWKSYTDIDRAEFITHDGSMGLVYLPTFGWFLW